MNHNELAEKNTKLSYSVAHSFLKKGIAIEFDELVSLCNLGLVKAANSFDESKGAKFSTYAIRIMQNEVLTHFRKSKKHNNVSSLDTPLDSEDSNSDSYVETIPDKSIHFEDDLADSEYIQEMYALLNDRERLCVQLKFFDKVGQKEIASFLGISKSYVAIIIQKALRKMHKVSVEQGVI